MMLGRLALALALMSATARADDPWLTFPGGDGPGQGKHVVLISGDEEYRSEEALPQLAQILSKHHGFRTTVLFAIEPDSGLVNPNRGDNIPGLAALDSADLMIIATRFRNLPDDQMARIDAFLKAGKPVIGLRTATHAFNLTRNDTKYKHYSYNSKEWDGGFGRQVLGETWISHHGNHGQQSTRGLIAPGQESNPIARGLKDGDIWGPSDVYGVRLPLPEGSTPIVMGQILVGMKPEDAPLEGAKNSPMMPVAWTKTYELPGGKPGKSFCTTMGAATDLANEGVRRLLVNATYWATGLADKIPSKADVALVGAYEPTGFRFIKDYQPTRKPADFAR